MRFADQIREDKKGVLKINFITVLRLCPCLGFLTLFVGKMPQLCLQLIRLSPHGSLRMLMTGSATTHLNPRDQCEYVWTVEQIMAD